MITSEQAIGVKLWLYFVAVVFVGIRWYVRGWLQSRITWSDIFMVISLVLYTGEEVTAILLHKDGFFNMPAAKFSIGGFPELLAESKDPQRLSRMLKNLFISSTLTFTTFWTIKMAFILLYYSLVPKGFRKMWITLHVASLVTVFTFIGFLVTNVFSCGDVSRNWTLDHDKLCLSFSKFDSVIYLTTVHLATDVFIYIIPFFLLPHLQLPRKQKFALALMFALGIVCIMCAVARTATVMAAPSFSFTDILVWDSGEMSLGFIVGCGPALKYLWLRITNVPQGLAQRQYRGESITTGTNNTRRVPGGVTTHSATVVANEGNERWDVEEGGVVVMHEITVESSKIGEEKKTAAVSVRSGSINEKPEKALEQV